MIVLLENYIFYTFKQISAILLISLHCCGSYLVNTRSFFPFCKIKSLHFCVYSSISKMFFFSFLQKIQTESDINCCIADKHSSKSSLDLNATSLFHFVVTFFATSNWTTSIAKFVQFKLVLCLWNFFFYVFRKSRKHRNKTGLFWFWFWLKNYYKAQQIEQRCNIY